MSGIWHGIDVTVTVIDVPIRNGPYGEPARHWVLDKRGSPTDFEGELVGARTTKVCGRDGAWVAKLGPKPRLTPQQAKWGDRVRWPGEPLRKVACRYNLSHNAILRHSP